MSNNESNKFFSISLTAHIATPYQFVREAVHAEKVKNVYMWELNVGNVCSDTSQFYCPSSNAQVNFITRSHFIKRLFILY